MCVDKIRLGNTCVCGRCTVVCVQRCVNINKNILAVNHVFDKTTSAVNIFINSIP